VAAAGGAAWAFVPAWLQARRGSHVVITTIHVQLHRLGIDEPISSSTS